FGSGHRKSGSFLAETFPEPQPFRLFSNQQKMPLVSSFQLIGSGTLSSRKMRTVDLIHRKRDGEELSPDEIRHLVEGYTRGDIPDYQASAFLMSVFFSGMTDREVSALTESFIGSG